MESVTIMPWSVDHILDLLIFDSVGFGVAVVVVAAAAAVAVAAAAALEEAAGPWE